MEISNGVAEIDYLVIRYPIFTVVDVAEYDKNGLPNCVPKTQADGIGAFVPLFTTSELARGFIAGFPLPGKCPLKFLKPEAMLAVLQDLESLGASHVGLDIVFQPKAKGGLYPIREFIEAAQRDASGSSGG